MPERMDERMECINGRDYTRSWAPGTRHKVSAETAGKVFDELTAKDALTPQNLVDVSRPEEAPLHKEFEWDDSKAAEEYRKEQARCLIRHLVIIPADNTPPVRMLFKVAPNESKYEPLHVILKSEDKTMALYKQSLSELRSFKWKYQTILTNIKAAGLVAAIEDKLKEALSDGNASSDDFS